MNCPRLRAVIFDFNGVIADDEATHFLAFQQALAEEGLVLTQDQYYGTYLGMDERQCTEALLVSVTGENDPGRVDRIGKRKAALFRTRTASSRPPLFPGVVEFVKGAGERCRLAIATGGRREQIEYALRGTPIEHSFSALVSAEDVWIGKPDPAIYRLALEMINKQAPPPHPLIQPAECLVIEDSLAGIRAALNAGMKVVAVTTTYPPHELAPAHLVLQSLERASVDSLESCLK